MGLEIDGILLGSQVEKMSDEQLADVVDRTTVFAKMSPIQKARIIRVLRSKGHTVGYMGDGINDAAALRDADVGISVDTAVDIAKESADIILLEKNLMVLERGVIEGRRTFGNILKYLNMTASSNFGNVFSVMGSSAVLPFLPMQPIQLLTQNLLYDISQITIPFDRVDKDFLRKPQKWNVPNIGRFMLFIGPVSSIFDYATFIVMWFVFGADTPEEMKLFNSGWFVEGLLSQTLIVHMIRTSRWPFLQSTASLPVLFLTALIMVIGMVIPFTPLNQLEVRELVRSLSEIEPKKRVLAFRLLEKSKAIAVFEELAPNQQADLIREMENPEVITIIEALDPDDRVKLFEELPAKIAKRLIANLSPQTRDAVNLLLGYPERSAGRLMSLRYLAVHNHITVGAALASVRESQLRDDELEMVFLIDSERFYRGFIRTVRLIKANPDTPVEMLLDGSNVAIRATDPEMKAVQMLKDTDLPALPVVDSEGRLLGDITFDDVIDLIQEEATETALSQGGVGNLLSRDRVWSDRLVRGSILYGKMPYNTKGESKKILIMSDANITPAMARLETRVKPEIKALWQKAADLEGVTLTDFVIASVQSAAYKTIEKHQTLKLSVEDAEAFVEAILNPPQPADALVKAALRYKQVMQNNHAKD